jgi:gamma-glutamylcyclotransferase (GGCT)/AIG2-like uncharacterized protein YtfP
MISVFVYGTLKPNEANYQKYCAGKVIREIKAFTWGQLFHLSLGYPAIYLREFRRTRRLSAPQI